MKIRLEGTPEELRAKGPQLIKALAARLGVDLARLADEDTLEKAQAEPELTSHYGPIRDLVKRSTKVYTEEINLMLREISEVLDVWSES